MVRLLVNSDSESTWIEVEPGETPDGLRRRLDARFGDYSVLDCEGLPSDLRNETDAVVTAAFLRANFHSDIVDAFFESSRWMIQRPSEWSQSVATGARSGALVPR